MSDTKEMTTTERSATPSVISDSNNIVLIDDINSELFLNVILFILKSFLIWYVKQLEFEYIFYEKTRNKRIDPKTGKEKDYQTNLKEIKTKINKIILDIKNKQNGFEVYEYDKGWQKHDPYNYLFPPPTKKAPAPSAPWKEKNSYFKERYIYIGTMFELKKMAVNNEGINKEKIDKIKEAYSDGWDKNEKTDKIKWSKSETATQNLEQIYARELYLYRKHRSLEMMLIPYTYRYFSIIYKEIYTDFFTYEYNTKINGYYNKIITEIILVISNNITQLDQISMVSQIAKLIYIISDRISLDTSYFNEKQNVKPAKEGDTVTIDDWVRERKKLEKSIASSLENTDLESIIDKTVEFKSSFDMFKINQQIIDDFNGLLNVFNSQYIPSVIALNLKEDPKYKDLSKDQMYELVKAQTIYVKKQIVGDISLLITKISKIFTDEDYNYYLYLLGDSWKLYLTPLDTEIYIEKTKNNIDKYNIEYVLKNQIYNIVSDNKLDINIESFIFKHNKKDSKTGEYGTEIIINIKNQLSPTDKGKMTELIKDIIGITTLKIININQTSTQTKVCSVCGEAKGIDDYSSKRWKGKASARICKMCMEKKEKALELEKENEKEKAKIQAIEEAKAKEEEKKAEEKEKTDAATTIQKMYRGFKGRKEAEIIKKKIIGEKKEAEQKMLKQSSANIKKNIKRIDAIIKRIEILSVPTKGEQYFTESDRTEVIFKNIAELVKTKLSKDLVMVGNYSIYMLMKQLGITIDRYTTTDIDGKICINKDDDIRTLRNEIMLLLKDNKYFVKTDSKKTEDKNSPIKVYSNAAMKEKDQIIDISFGVEDQRCKDPIIYNDMKISSANSTFLHYTNIFDTLKQNYSYPDTVIEEMSEPVEIKKIINKGTTYEREIKIRTPRWNQLIMKYKEDNKIPMLRAVNKEEFGKFLETTSFNKPEQILFMQNLSSIYYKLSTWKDSLTRLKLVFEKLQMNEKGGKATAVKGGKRTIRKKNNKKKYTFKKYSKIKRKTKRKHKTIKKRKQLKKTINKLKK